MKAIWKGIASVLFYAISAALLFYAASRSLSFISSTLPPDQQIIGYLALAATSGGMLAWLLIFLYKAQGTGQKVTAGLMVAVDMFGEIALFSMDTLYESGQSGMIAQMAPEEIRAVIIGMSGLIALNIMATVVFHLVDSEHARRMREDSVRDDLENKAMKEIEKRGEEIARNLGPAIAQQWASEFESRFADMSALGLGAPPTLQRRADPGGGLRLPWAKRPALPVHDKTGTKRAEAADAYPCPTCGELATMIIPKGGRLYCENCIDQPAGNLEAAAMDPAPFRTPNGHKPH